MGDPLKYQNLAAFEKHLDQAAPDHLAHVFLVITPCSYERKKVVDRILFAIRKKEPDLHLSAEEAAASTLDSAIEKLNTFSLLGGKQALYLDAVDKLKKGGISQLAHYAVRPSPFSYLILGAGSGKSLSEIYTQGKKEVIACDLSDEKPWDRKDRLKRQLAQSVALAGKVISPDALEHLLENVGLDLPGLEQEVFKLITYAGENKQISLKDVEALCAQQKSSTLWQLAEALVWKEGAAKHLQNVDLSLLLPLIAQMRSQIQQGLTIALLLEQGFGSAEISHYLPAIRSNALDKILPIVRAKRSSFFRRGLNLLFEIELMAKNGSLDPGLLLDLFIAKFHRVETVS